MVKTVVFDLLGLVRFNSRCHVLIEAIAQLESELMEGSACGCGRVNVRAGQKKNRLLLLIIFDWKERGCSSLKFDCLKRCLIQSASLWEDS